MPSIVTEISWPGLEGVVVRGHEAGTGQQDRSGPERVVADDPLGELDG